ncbi:MAG: hypothetical protein P1U74_00690 [Legionellaceae bacterium]|nr:hypothetical protein [Legionellaceae bacterium]
MSPAMAELNQSLHRLPEPEKVRKILQKLRLDQDTDPSEIFPPSRIYSF